MKIKPQFLNGQIDIINLQEMDREKNSLNPLFGNQEMLEPCSFHHQSLKCKFSLIQSLHGVEGNRSYSDKPFWTNGMSLTHPNRIPNSLISNFVLQFIKLIHSRRIRNFVTKRGGKTNLTTYLTPRPFCIALSDRLYAFSDMPLNFITVGRSRMTSSHLF